MIPRASCLLSFVLLLLLLVSSTAPVQLTKVEKSLRKRLDARVRQLEKMRVKGEDLALYEQSVIAAGNLLNATVGRPAFQLVKDAAGKYKVGEGEAVAPTDPPPLPLAMFVDTKAGGASFTRRILRPAVASRKTPASRRARRLTTPR